MLLSTLTHAETASLQRAIHAGSLCGTPQQLKGAPTTSQPKTLRSLCYAPSYPKVLQKCAWYSDTSGSCSEPLLLLFVAWRLCTFAASSADSTAAAREKATHVPQSCRQHVAR